MLSNNAIRSAMLQVSAENALREAQHRAWWGLVKRMYAFDMQCWYPTVSAAGVRRCAALAAAGSMYSAAGAGAFGARGRVGVAGRLPGLHSGPSPPAVGMPALHHR